MEIDTAAQELLTGSAMAAAPIFINQQYVIKRSHEHLVMPWANGRGTSIEVACDTPGTKGWRWRVAIAPVMEDGDFSYLANVDRQLTIIVPDTAMVLDVDGAYFDCQPFNVVAFPGDAKRIHAHLLNGPLTDLGLMVVRNTATGKLSCFWHPGPLDRATMIIALSDDVCLNVAGTLVYLCSWDACIFPANFGDDDPALLSVPSAFTLSLQKGSIAHIFINVM